MSHPNGPRTGRPPLHAPRGAVSTPHALASAAGLEALQRGGSAVDAAIAANAVLCVVYPHMAGLGGDGFWLLSGPGTDGVEGWNASGPSARAATPEHYRRLGHAEELPQRGPLAALTVPGAVDGWRAVHERHGKLPWDALFDAAIRYARDGMPVSRSLADWIARDEPILRRDPLLAAAFLPGGAPPREGRRLVFPDLARSLERLARDGARAGFYEGETAERLCAAIAPGGSPLRRDDLARFRAEQVDPIRVSYRDVEVVELPPNTQGFTALQILNVLEGYDLAGFGDGSADYLHHAVEAVKLAFADRDEWLTDPAFVELPLDRLLSKEYAAERRALVDPARALAADEVAPGIRYRPGVTRRAPGGDTCAFCAVDGDGLVASVIQSIYHDFGAGVTGGETGIILQNRGAFFSLDEGHPNRLAPGKRTAHTLIPALALRGGEPWLAYGTMGGEGQPQTQAALLTRLVDFGYDVQQAIEAPRWLMGRTWGSASRDLWLEGRIGDEVARELTLRGQPVQWLGPWSGTLGHAHAIRIDREQGLLEGGADPRGDGAALGH